jgi:hypothetical protein
LGRDAAFQASVDVTIVDGRIQRSIVAPIAAHHLGHRAASALRTRPEAE